MMSAPWKPTRSVTCDRHGMIIAMDAEGVVRHEPDGTTCDEIPVVRHRPSDHNPLRTEVNAVRAVLTERERELLELKGPCGNCRLHYAHSGPCAP